MTNEAPAYNLHPIRLQFVHLKRIRFNARVLPAKMSPEEAAAVTSGRWLISVSGNVGDDEAIVEATVRCSFVDPTKKEVAPEALDVTVAAEEQGPYVLEVSAVAGFKYDAREISKKNVEQWCNLGSFFIVAPYLRGIIAEITRDAGFPTVHLPLLEVPTFRAPASPNVDQLADTRKQGSP